MEEVLRQTSTLSNIGEQIVWRAPTRAAGAQCGYSREGRYGAAVGRADAFPWVEAYAIAPAMDWAGQSASEEAALFWCMVLSIPDQLLQQQPGWLQTQFFSNHRQVGLSQNNLADSAKLASVYSSCHHTLALLGPHLATAAAGLQYTCTWQGAGSGGDSVRYAWSSPIFTLRGLQWPAIQKKKFDYANSTIILLRCASDCMYPVTWRVTGFLLSIPSKSDSLNFDSEFFMWEGNASRSSESRFSAEST